ncbi:hypothetical protein TrRE_jg8472, partial [Triparma retinervis]
MTLLSSTPPPSPNLGFPPHFTLSLSAGPIPLPSDPTLHLVSSHVSVGGWGAGTVRQTFFYVYSLPSFTISCVTPVINFGLDGRLEYNTNMEEGGGYLYLSVGRDNCETALVRIRMTAILDECRPPGEE